MIFPISPKNGLYYFIRANSFSWWDGLINYRGFYWACERPQITTSFYRCRTVLRWHLGFTRWFCRPRWGHTWERRFSPESTSQVVHIPISLRTAKNVFVRHDSHRNQLQPPYDSPSRVIERGNKTFKLNLGASWEDIVLTSIDFAEEITMTPSHHLPIIHFQRREAEADPRKFQPHFHYQKKENEAVLQKYHSQCYRIAFNPKRKTKKPIRYDL